MMKRYYVIVLRVTWRNITTRHYSLTVENNDQHSSNESQVQSPELFSFLKDSCQLGFSKAKHLFCYYVFFSRYRISEESEAALQDWIVEKHTLSVHIF